MMEDLIYYISCVAVFSLLLWLFLVALSVDTYSPRGERILEEMFIADSVIFVLSFVTLVTLKAIVWICG